MIFDSLNPAPRGSSVPEEEQEPIDYELPPENEDELPPPTENNAAQNAPAAFDSNLAETMSAEGRGKLVGKLVELYASDDSARADWLESVAKGHKLLGIKFEEVSEPWEGASSAVHPLLASAVLAFQARATKNLFPASGPAKIKIKGKATPQKLGVGQRVSEDINYVLTDTPDYRSELEKALFNAGLTGSGFTKTWWAPGFNRPLTASVPVENIVLSPDASDASTALRVTHVMKKHQYEVAELQRAGFYRNPNPDDEVEDKRNPDMETGATTEIDVVTEEKASIAGIDKTKDSRKTILEMQIRLILDDFDEALEEQGDMEDKALPYVVTIDKDDNELLALRRNWLENDPLRLPRQHIVQYQYILTDISPYGLGLVHIIGQSSNSATAILRTLIDGGALASLQAGYKTRSVRIRNDTSPLKPGEFRDADVTTGALRDGFYQPQFKEPSATLANLLGVIVDGGKELANVSTASMENLPHNAASFAVLALLEKEVEPQAAVFTRLHSSMAQQLRIFAKLMLLNLNPQYEYDVDGDGQPGGAQGVSRQADLSQYDIVPVSNPNEATTGLKLMKLQALLQQIYPVMPDQFDKAKLAQASVGLLGEPEFLDLLVPQQEPKPMDPVSENQNLLTGKPVKAFQEQEHDAHIRCHMALLLDPRTQKLLEQAGQMSQPLIQAFYAHIAEHAGMRARNEISKALRAPLPQPGQPVPPPVEMAMAQAAEQVLAQQRQAEAPQIPIELQLELRAADREDRKVEADIEDKRGKRVLEVAKVIASAGKTDIDSAIKLAETRLAKYEADQALEAAKMQARNRPKGSQK